MNLSNLYQMTIDEDNQVIMSDQNFEILETIAKRLTLKINNKIRIIKDNTQACFQGGKMLYCVGKVS